MNQHNTRGGVTHIDTARPRRRARPAPRITEADLDAHAHERRAWYDDCMGIILAERARAEREALAIANGARGDLSRYSDSEIDEIEALQAGIGISHAPRRRWALWLRTALVTAAVLAFLAHLAGLTPWQP